MERAIVFGGSGFVGSSVVEALLSHGIEVCAVVKPGFEESLEQFRLKDLNAIIVECDLREVSQLRNRLPWNYADAFYQLAWEGLSGEVMTDYSVQLMDVRWMLDSIVSAAELGCKKFVGAGTISQDELHIQSGRMYQNDRHRIFRTAALTCEYMGQSVANDHNIEFVWPIISNVYGEGEIIPRLVTTFVQKLLRHETMPLSSGTQNYSFIHRHDAGEAFYLLGKYGIPYRRYNIAGSEVRQLCDYLKQIRDIVAPGMDLQLGQRQESGVPLDKNSFDIKTLSEDTGFAPKISFAEGIKKLADWLR